MQRYARVPIINGVYCVILILKGVIANLQNAKTIYKPLLPVTLHHAQLESHPQAWRHILIVRFETDLKFEHVSKVGSKTSNWTPEINEMRCNIGYNHFHLLHVGLLIKTNIIVE